MYAVDAKDCVVPLTDLPQSCTGAPFPIVLATEMGVTLVYLTAAPRKAAVVEFYWYTAHYCGPLNDEAFTGHPLASRGLEPYGAFEVLQSSWVRLLEQRNRVHPKHMRETYRDRRHFILRFKDSTFECIAGGYKASIRDDDLGTVMQSLAQDFD
jgi:hypothetical protein